MIHRRWIALLLLAAASLCAQDHVAILGALVVDGTGAEPTQQNVLIRAGRIVAVGAEIAIPADARRVDARGQTLLPGLIDLHTHVPYSAVTGVSGDWGKNLKAYLYSGVTTVVDFGTYPETFEPVRRLIEQGVWIAPRVNLAARLTTPGGHGAEGGRGDFFSQEVTTAREARAAVRRVLPYKPDVIKVFTDGWRYGAAPDMSSMTEETLTALVEEAHRHNMKVLTHTVTLAKAKEAVRAGVDVIAHGIGDAQADLELVRLMQQKGTTYAPTLAVYEPRQQRTLAPMLSELLEPAARKLLEAAAARPATAVTDVPRARRWRILMENTAALRAGGVSFGLGTDAGVTGTYHGWASLRELELLVMGGLTPLEALTAGTGNSAKALGVDADRGTVSPGKLADLVLVEGTPHKSISDIYRIRSVFLGGREIDRASLARQIDTSEPTPIPPRKAPRMIADFQRSDGRTNLGSLVVNSTDSGHDNSKMLYLRTGRKGGNYALTVVTRLGEKDKPFAAVNFPLSPGAIEPVDVRAYRGVRFDARGDGSYRLLAVTRGVRDQAHFQAPFRAQSKWKNVKISFDSLRREETRLPASWTGTDLLQLVFEISGPASTHGWLELDNVRFY